MFREAGHKLETTIPVSEEKSDADEVADLDNILLQHKYLVEYKQITRW